MVLHSAIALSGILGGVPAEPVPMPQVWYREVFLGELPAAAEGYENLYLSAAAEKLPLRTRLRAAFRAGASFERLGKPQSAALAYRWVGSHL